MLVAYLDEFGHIGPYKSADDDRHNNHPAFGYAGIVLPAVGVRSLGGLFAFLKRRLLQPEITRAGAHPSQWEKKGASLLTTGNHRRYGNEIRPALARLSQRLQDVGGEVVFFGQEKPLGDAETTNEASSKRSEHMLITSVRQLCKLADDRGEHIMVFLDAVDDAPRQHAVTVMGGFIYGSTDESLRRIVEVPMQLESKHYALVQYADWMCALVGRASHFHLVPQSEFDWAPSVFRESVTKRVKVSGLSFIQRRRDLGPDLPSLKAAQLSNDDAWHSSQFSTRRRARPTETGRLTQSLAENASGQMAAVYAAARSARPRPERDST